MTTAAKTKSVGRPAAFSAKAILAIRSAKAKSRLQEASERRAIVLQIIEAGGTSTLEQLNDHFGFDARPHVSALISSGWITVESDK